MKDKMSRRAWTDDKLLSRLLHNKSNKTRWQNIRVLRSRPSKELFTKCANLIKSRNYKNRILGIDILAQFGLTPRPFLKQTIKIYFDLLDKEEKPEVLMSLLYAIGHNNETLNKRQVNKLCALSKTENNLIKEGLVFALLSVDNLEAINTLIKLSADPLSHIRNWATFGIGTQIERNNKNIRNALWDRIGDNHQETKLEALLGLAKRKDERVNKIIAKELLDGEYGNLLFEAILETGNKQFLPILRQALKSGKADKGVSPEWLVDLQKCMSNLRKGK